MIAIRRITAQQLQEKPIYNLIAKSVYKATAEKLSRLIDILKSRNSLIYIAEDCDYLMGIMAAIEDDRQRFEIKALFVNQGKRGKGAGRELVAKLVSDSKDSKIVAETDVEAVQFYHSLGFRIHSLGEKYPGIERFSCIHDHMDWSPCPYVDIIHTLQAADIRCWVSGGIALDLHVGYQTREHHDVDISIFRKDQMVMREVFKDWEIYHTHAPGLRYWHDGNYLEEIPNVWIRGDQKSPWAFEVMFENSVDEEWVYRRNSSIRKAIKDIILTTDDGVPYLRPEIQLLYKGGGSSFREKKNLADLKTMLPLLSGPSIDWLIDSLRADFPEGHEWIHILANSRS
ncbi:MAG: GNAT family N-acetyltransferase [Spirochaetales bacterium]|jgi:GNAT superfamily N-acetyltransferase|nr:GNAT family N-acetyltransferase [Spirochaetales bacterium]